MTNLPAVPDHEPYGRIMEDPLSQRDYELLKREMRTHRDLLLCKMLRATGLRINELLRVTPADVRDDGVTLEILVKRGKKRLKAGDQAVYEPIPLGPELSVEIRAYVRGNNIGAGDTLFGIKDRQVRNIFTEAGRRAIGRPVHPHEFRGLYISWLLDNGLGIEATAKMVGHADTKTTAKHYYKLTAEKRRAIQREIPA